MIETLSGAPGTSTVERCTRCAPESCHSIVARASPGHGGPPGGLASRVHSPTSGSSRLSASSAVGWSIALLLPPVGGWCGADAPARFVAPTRDVLPGYRRAPVGAAAAPRERGAAALTILCPHCGTPGTSQPSRRAAEGIGVTRASKNRGTEKHLVAKFRERSPRTPVNRGER